ncbi:MAG: hypothetical protein HFE67_07090, partial [Erysipelotrichaceae bacterium]|nr:hypothetical protein [Erysipelotrichaceae bacterium]
RIEAQIEDGYLVYESDELGIVAVIADEKEVAGSYYPGANTGGALTGDTNNPLLYMGIGCTSLGILFFLISDSVKRKKQRN